MKKLVRFAALAATIGMTFAPIASNAATTTAFSPGDLIKGSGDTVYYFGNDGVRYVFPNSKTYFTWYTDFSTVKQIPDGLLSTLPLARQNITYRPGVKMVKITTDPRVYVVDRGGILRHVGSEQLAATLYQVNWKNNVEDVPDAFFVNYRIGTAIQTASDFSPADVRTLTTTIDQDKQIDTTITTVSIGSTATGFVPASITIKKGSTVTWTNRDAEPRMVTGSNWGSGTLNYNESYSHTFNTVGSFDYHEKSHTVMQGTINVK